MFCRYDVKYKEENARNISKEPSDLKSIETWELKIFVKNISIYVVLTQVLTSFECVTLRIYGTVPIPVKVQING